MFRLWEIKKFTGAGSINGTITTAYIQLQTRALRYLVRYSVMGQHSPNQEVVKLCAGLVDHWITGSAQAAAGVGVAASIKAIPKSCFAKFGKAFPLLTKPRRLRGFVAGTADFSGFAVAVRDYIWKGL
jgi:hypothetical protein